MILKRAGLITLFSLLTLTVLCSDSLLGAELFFYKPYEGTLQYDLTIHTHALLDTGLPEQYGKVVRDHEDIMALSQRVEETEEGLLDIATTVDKINPLPSSRGFGPPGVVYKREEILGNTQHIKINLLGKVEEAQVLPHIASQYFWTNGQDGPPLDFYNVLTLLNPRFPLELLDPGDSWESEDVIELEVADPLPLAGLMVIRYELEMTVQQKIKYTLLDFVEKKGYRCARISFEAEFKTDGVIYGGSGNGRYVDGLGNSSGEFCFAPQEGILVSASMTHTAFEKLSMDGQIRTNLTPREVIVLYAYDQTTVPLPWHSERTVSLELTEARAISRK
jgi:hypothetical protein